MNLWCLHVIPLRLSHGVCGIHRTEGLHVKLLLPLTTQKQERSSTCQSLSLASKGDEQESPITIPSHQDRERIVPLAPSHPVPLYRRRQEQYTRLKILWCLPYPGFVEKVKRMGYIWGACKRAGVGSRELNWFSRSFLSDWNGSGGQPGGAQDQSLRLEQVY